MEYIGNILYDESLLKKNRKFIIFGAGVYGRKILQYLDINGVKNNIICFCDSDDSLGGQNIEGIPICQIKDVCLQHPNEIYLLSGKYSKEMYKILKENAIRKIHILFI